MVSKVNVTAEESGKFLLNPMMAGKAITAAEPSRDLRCRHHVGRDRR
jgi:hypothetical protein